MLIIRKLLVYCLLFCPIICSSLERNIRFTNISNQTGLPNNTVNAICQDQKGFLWFGTDNGLCRYDGKNFMVFDAFEDSSETVLSKKVIDIFQDDRGCLWIVSPRNLRRFNIFQEKFEKLDNDALAINSHTICQTSEGNIYLGIGDKLCRFNRKKNRFEPVLIYGRDIRGRFTAIEQTSDGYLWMGTRTDGLVRISTELNSIDRLRENDALDRWLVSNRISSLFFDKDEKVLWIGTDDCGICCYDILKKSFYIPDGIPKMSVTSFCKDADGSLWIGSDKGVYIYDICNRKIVNHLTKSYADRTGLSDNFISDIVRDREDNILVGTRYGGVDVFARTFRHFRYTGWGEGPDNLSGRTVRQIIPYGDRYLLIATEDGNLNLMDRVSMSYREICLSGKDPMNPYALFVDSKERLWVGSKYNGLYMYDIRSGKDRHFTIDNYPGLSIDNILSIEEDFTGTIWIGTASGIAIYDENNDSFIPFDPQRFRKQSIECIMNDSEGNIWIATGGKGLFRYDAQNSKVESYMDFMGLNSAYMDNWVNYIYQDSRNYVWFSTNNSGLCCFDPGTGLFSNYTTKDFLPSNTIYSIIEDSSKDIWVSTDNGLSRLDMKKMRITNYSESEGLPNRQFTNNSVCRTEDGVLYFGTINGLLSFHPDSLEVSDDIAHVEFTEFLVLGKRINVGQESLIKTDGDNGILVELNYAQSKSFSLKYTVPTISHTSSVSFSTKLGNEAEWTYPGSITQTSFANLRPGEYDFMVRASFNNKWTGEEPVSTVRIIVKPPFWASRPAWVGYVLLFILGMIAIYSFIREKHKQNARKLVEKLEKDKAEELNRMRMNFFTNISHQVRIPLSLIIAPLETMLDNGSFKDDILRKMNLIYRNAVKMKMLLDELLMFSKIKNASESVKVSKGDISKLVTDVAAGFQLVAEEKCIAYTVSVDPVRHDVWFSPKILEKILFNLLSNAFKFTDTGEVRLSARVEMRDNLEFLSVEVKDTGIGIRKEELQRIFDGYYQVEDNRNSGNKGFGIGLALTKELVKLHKGDIEVESEIGSGSIFKALIGVDKSLFSDIQFAEVQSIEITDYDFLLNGEGDKDIRAQGSQEKSNKPKILLAEDDLNLLRYYEELFQNSFVVYSATNGNEALSIAKKFSPDIIVSDVIMPEKDGYELTRQIKGDFTTSHIPVILLTAKTGLPAQLEGLDSGADLYIEKPFHPSALLRNVRNMLETKKRMIIKFHSGEALTEDFVMDERDRKFLKIIDDSILSNLANEDYSVEDLMKSAAVSRTLLHLKLKALVGMSATEYINSVRIKESIKLLIAGARVSEAAFSTGFASPNYYSRCFRKLYGKSPREYVEEMKNKRKNTLD